MTVINVEGPGIEPGTVKIADPGDKVRFDTPTGPVVIAIPGPVVMTTPEVVRRVRRRRRDRISRERTIHGPESDLRIRVDQVLGYTVLAVEQPATDGHAYDVGLAFCSPKDRRNWSRDRGRKIALNRMYDPTMRVETLYGASLLSVRELVLEAVRLQRPFVPEQIRKAVENAARAAIGIPRRPRGVQR